MIGTHTAEGYELSLEPQGAGRFVVAAFLALWLCGWAVGEVFALTVLAWGVRAWLAGRDVLPPGSMPGPALALGAGLFVLVWLVFWTIGGVAALRELLLLTAGRDRIVAAPDALVVERRRGPFGSTTRIPRDRVRGLRCERRSGTLVAEAGRGVTLLSRLGTREQRVAARDELCRELGLQEVAPAAESGLPDGWEEIITPEGERVLVSSPRARRQQAAVTALIAVAVAGVALSVTGRALTELAFWPLALMASAAVVGLAWLGLWLARGRVEWRVGSGRITQRRRYGANVRDEFEGHRLELDSHRDSDGDEWFNLDLVSADEPAPALGRRVSRRTRRRVASSMRDDAMPRRLGTWLAARADIPFDDRTSPERRAADLAALRAELEKAGPLGRLAGRLIDRVGPVPGAGGDPAGTKP